MSLSVDDFQMFQALYAVQEQMDRAFSAHGSFSIISGVMVCWELFMVV